MKVGISSAFVGLGVFLAGLFVGYSAKRTEPTAQPVSDHANAFYLRMVAYHQRMDGNVPGGAIVFLGDSLTQGLNVGAVDPRAVNYGIGSDTINGARARVPKYPSLTRAAAVVLQIGINDLTACSPDELALRYVQLISSIPQACPIYVVSLFPVAKDKGRVTADAVAKSNDLLRAICLSEPRCRFVDVASKLEDDSGRLRPDLDSGDGIHLNPRGNSVVIATLRRVVSDTIASAK